MLLAVHDWHFLWLLGAISVSSRTSSTLRLVSPMARPEQEGGAALDPDWLVGAQAL